MLIENLNVMFTTVWRYLTLNKINISSFISFVQSFGKYWRPTKYKELVQDSMIGENM